VVIQFCFVGLDQQTHTSVRMYNGTLAKVLSLTTETLSHGVFSASLSVSVTLLTPYARIGLKAHAWFKKELFIVLTYLCKRSDQNLCADKE
jgi:hypothetical protein